MPLYRVFRHRKALANGTVSVPLSDQRQNLGLSLAEAMLITQKTRKIRDTCEAHIGSLVDAPIGVCTGPIREKYTA